MLSEMRWMMKERKESLDCLKGIAIVLVMFGHVQVHNRMTDPYLYDVIKSLQMPLFFLISGYLAGAGTKIRDLAHYRAVMKKRAVSYLLPFFSWLVIQHITYVPRALATVLFQLDYGLWFLMVLFLFTWLSCSAQLAEVKGKKEWMFWLSYFGGCGLILLAYLAGWTFLSPSLLVVYLPYYTLSYFFGLHEETVKRWLPVIVRRAAAYGGGAVCLLMAAVLDLVTVTGPRMLIVQMFASFLGCAAVIQAVLDWTGRGRRLRRGLARLGRYTLEIYVLHYQFAAVLNPDRHPRVFWSPEGLLYSGAAFVVMSLITAAAIYMINQIRWFRLFLFGKRLP